MQIWGELVGLAPNPSNGGRLKYNKNLDRPDIRPVVERTLNNIKAILEEAGKVDTKYGPPNNIRQSRELSTSKGIDIFKGSYERFKMRVKKHQKDTSTWKTTQWAIHDSKKFEESVNRLEKLMDGLEKVTKSLGLLQKQQARLQEEIDSISDVQSLRLLRDASSHTSSLLSVSDAASRRLISIESIMEQQSLNSNAQSNGTSDTFFTTRSRSTSSGSMELHVPGAWPQSIKSKSSLQHQQQPPPTKIRLGVRSTTAVSCGACLEEHYKCVQNVAKDQACGRCVQLERSCSFAAGGSDVPEAIPPLSENHVPFLEHAIPQNQRIVSTLVQRVAIKPYAMNFTARDAYFGQNLIDIKNEDEKYWNDHSGQLVTHAYSGSSAAKRMFIEIRNIRSGKVPFVSAAPLNERLDEVLASIEGPPGTPYEGGVFWITVKLSSKDPFAPPLLRFHTKVYHPNISPQGHICADYTEKWNAVLSAGSQPPNSKKPDSWFAAKSSEVRWSLGALLTALCALLASPDADDPLVPEIAQTYLEDYDKYCENARLYTTKFASRNRPDYDQLLFFEEMETQDIHPVMSYNSPSLSSCRAEAGSLADNDSAISVSTPPPPDSTFVLPRKPTSSLTEDQLQEAYDSWEPDVCAYKDWDPSFYLIRPLYCQINGSLLGHQWHEVNRRKFPRLWEAGSWEDLQDYLELVHCAQYQLLRSRATPPKVTVSELGHALLEKATIELRRPLIETQPDLLAFYNHVQILCHTEIMEELRHQAFRISHLSFEAPYPITFQNLRGPHEHMSHTHAQHITWNMPRRWKDFLILNEKFELWSPSTGWTTSPHSTHDTQPDPEHAAPFLEAVLNRLLRTHLSSLLLNSDFLAFIRPSGVEAADQPFFKECQIESTENDVPFHPVSLHPVEHLAPLPYAPINVLSFIPYFCFSGILVQIFHFETNAVTVTQETIKFIFTSPEEPFQIGWGFPGRDETNALFWIHGDEFYYWHQEPQDFRRRVQNAMRGKDGDKDKELSRWNIGFCFRDFKGDLRHDDYVVVEFAEEEELRTWAGAFLALLTLSRVSSEES